MKQNVSNQLKKYCQEYEAVKRRIKEIGFIAEGSLIERYAKCGKLNCRCHKDPQKKHGPYYQLTWKKKQKRLQETFLSMKHSGIRMVLRIDKH